MRQFSFSFSFRSSGDFFLSISAFQFCRFQLRSSCWATPAGWAFAGPPGGPLSIRLIFSPGLRSAWGIWGLLSSLAPGIWVVRAYQLAGVSPGGYVTHSQDNAQIIMLISRCWNSVYIIIVYIYIYDICYLPGVIRLCCFIAQIASGRYWAILLFINNDK